MDLTLDGTRSGDWFVLHVGGEIDLATAPTLRERMTREIDGGEHRVIIDLTAVDFIDSTGLGSLIGALKRVRGHGGELRLVCAEPRILKVFEITGLDRVFEIHGDVAASVSG